MKATTFRFDRSDLMPGAIGTRAFWASMVDFVGGKEAEGCGYFYPESMGGAKVELTTSRCTQ
ncbi:MAG: hypothetical protein AB8B97_09570 [Granulosicoccus sp.]